MWVSANGTSWEQSLPPMPNPHYGAPAVNTGGHPEYLIVAGGFGEFNDKVEILEDMKWSTVSSPLPMDSSECTRLTIHNGNVYLFGALWKEEAESALCVPISCKLESLHQTGAHVDWKEIATPDAYPALITMFAFQGDLIAIYAAWDFSYQVRAFSPVGKRWVQVHLGLDSWPDSIEQAVALPSGKLLVVAHSRHVEVVEADVRVFLYHPAGGFSYGALDRLEAIGIPVLTSLTAEGLAKAIGLPSMPEVDSLEMVIVRWINGFVSEPATWRSLYDVLKQLHHKELSQQIEKYLKCPLSLKLKEQCTSVIMSALLQQRSLEPDQLHIRLPDYVPATVKQSLIRTFKAHLSAAISHTILRTS